MPKEVIRVKIKKDGSAVVAVEGVAGKSCTDLTGDLEVFLGKPQGEKEFTADYYKPEPKAPEPWIKRT